jgi:hypothetical protein
MLRLPSWCSRAVIFLSVFACLFYAGVVFASDVPGAQERFELSFGQGDFRVTQDAVRYELPENGMYKIIPRSRNSMVWTQFPLPENASRYKEWTVTANVNSSEGAGAGVGVWYDDGGYMLLFFPDGRGLMRYYEGKSVGWSSEIKVANFAFPAKVSITRDVNGSMIGRVNEAIVAVRLVGVDLKKTKLPMVKSVSFATLSQGQSGTGSATYERLDVQAWGQNEIKGLQ